MFLATRFAARQRANFRCRASTEFIFFSIFGILYLMWATVPLSIGGSKQFDAGKLLMYPITLRKLFAVDFISELTTLHSVFAVPAVLAHQHRRRTGFRQSHEGTDSLQSQRYSLASLYRNGFLQSLVHSFDANAHEAKRSSRLSAQLLV